MPDKFMVGNAKFTVHDYVLEERCGQHDLLTVTGTGSAALAGHAGEHAKLEIFQGSNSRIVVGYLDTQASSVGQARDSISTGYVLGASSVMRSGVERQWKDKRPYEIAQDVIRPYGFCLEMDTYSHAISLFAQSAESDWQLLNRLAMDIGMYVIGTNTVIRIIDPAMEIRRRMGRPLYTYDVTKLSAYTVGGSPTPLGYEGRVFSGVDKFGESFTVTANEGAMVTLPAPETVRSLEDALSARERIERRRHRLRQATCRMRINPLLRSGTTVALTNRAETRVWFIVEARHTMSFHSSTTELVMNRDENPQRTMSTSWRTEKWPTPVLMHGRWVGSERWEREL